VIDAAKGAGRFLLRALGTLVVALPAWTILGYLLTAPLGAIYGWSGHPAIPAAPVPVYVGLYLVVLPALCLAGAWTLVRWIENRLRARRRAVPR
jgi:hypothetical protein